MNKSVRTKGYKMVSRLPNDWTEKALPIKEAADCECSSNGALISECFVLRQNFCVIYELNPGS